MTTPTATASGSQTILSATTLPNLSQNLCPSYTGGSGSCWNPVIPDGTYTFLVDGSSVGTAQPQYDYWYEECGWDGEGDEEICAEPSGGGVSLTVTVPPGSHTVQLQYTGTGNSFWTDQSGPWDGSEEYITGMTSSTQFNGTGLQGYVNPKYVVVGVTYAPFGPSPSTWVQYSNSTYVGDTNSLASSFENSTTFGISVQHGFGGKIFGVSAGGIDKSSWSTSNSQESTNSTTVTTSINVQNGEETFGTANYDAPVNHDYDLIWVWLNPAIVFTVGGNTVDWGGYGYDENDQNAMEIVPVALGYLNGDFGPITNWEYYTRSERTWAAAHETFPSGQSAALNSSDFAAIAAIDPFSVSTYGTNYIGSNPPSQTADGRFTFGECDSGASFDYVQASPGDPHNPTPAPITSCNLTYTSLTTIANSEKTTTSQEFATDTQLSASFLAQFEVELKSSNTLTWTTTAQQSIVNGTTLTQAFQDQGPPCNNVFVDQGPCVPVYGQSSSQPGEFFVYQDNVYGTFMFAPIDYY